MPTEHVEMTEKHEQVLEIFKALSHPMRLKIIMDLINDEEGSERHCTSFGLTLSKATRSHHFKLLKDVGLIIHVDKGNHSLAKLRRDELNIEFPGLIELLQLCSSKKQTINTE
ncbi:ArsR/SmtB family transcription factor [Vibrio mimicus]|uniref:ArsR/SmtB family transcription factor n=1 Tax=Vibrio mimicus TaxID=674 RepID=UPI0011D7C486|nr:helix-turn-helix domain-containing protein [Vibrio mimicus]TXY44906.1 helix-turn-helix transcriptional regulator [Vibrio mimicus]